MITTEQQLQMWNILQGDYDLDFDPTVIGEFADSLIKAFEILNEIEKETHYDYENSRSKNR